MKKILFDEGVPLPLRQLLEGFQVTTVQELGLTGANDCAVLERAAEAGFDLLVTNDKNIRHQQKDVRLAIYELPFTNWPELRKRADVVVRDIKALVVNRADHDDANIDE